MAVGSGSGKRSFSNTFLGMMLTLAPRSQSALLNIRDPMEHGMVGHPGSLFFSEASLAIAALHSSVSLTVLGGISRLFPMMSLKYREYVGTCRASKNGMLMLSLRTMSTNLLNCSSSCLPLRYRGLGGRILVSISSISNSGSSVTISGVGVDAFSLMMVSTSILGLGFLAPVACSGSSVSFPERV